ncbi:MAG: hypothetical protein K8S62_07445 [Candidatus Sabulitectum sp.]|nr:hypothetical protein [Candidatus Sabulitectum sp.]
MKKFILLVIMLLSLAAFAGNDNSGFISEGSHAAVSSETGTDAITITVLNTFSCGYAQQILGLDFSSDSGVLVFVSSEDDIMYSCDPDNGDKISELALSYTAAPDQFGVCVDINANCYFNDFDQNHMYWWDTSSWHLMTNPAGDDGRGMDFDGNRIWETFNWTTKQIMSFNTDGSGVQYYEIPELGSAQPSGLATFPCGSDLGIVVTSYNTYNFYFYSFDGSTLTSLGFIACPLTCTSSLGLAYSPGRDTFFWSHSNSSGDHSISELEIDITGFALAQSTWGSIKAIDFN